MVPEKITIESLMIEINATDEPEDYGIDIRAHGRRPDGYQGSSRQDQLVGEVDYTGQAECKTGERPPQLCRKGFVSARPGTCSMPSRRRAKILPPRRPTGRALDFMAELVAGPTPEDGITFCAYLLPQARGRVVGASMPRWRWLELLSPEDQDMLALAESWVRYPEEDQRCAVLDAGMAGDDQDARRVGRAGGRLERRQHAAAGCRRARRSAAIPDRQGGQCGVLSALARVDRKSRAATLKLFVNMGMQLAHQGVRRRRPHCLQCVGADR